MKKIMFNDKFHLTQAVLDGTKRQTRRIIISNDAFERGNKEYWSKQEIKEWNEEFTRRVLNMPESKRREVEHPKYKVGEIVAIAQAYKDIYPNADFELVKNNEFMTESAGWANKMFVRADLMPHQIRITNVHVERLQDISEEDCLKEGVKFVGKLKADGVNDYFSNVLPTPKHPNSNIVGLFNSPRVAYAELLDRVSGKGTWQSNPFVWVYDFELVK